MSPFANLTFQLAFDPAGENFHTAALTLGAEDDSGQATPLLSNFNVRHGASFAIRQSETILGRSCHAGKSIKSSNQTATEDHTPTM